MAHALVDFDHNAFPTRTDITTNGDFSVGTDWTLGSGASISGGVLSYDGSQVAASQTTQTPATSLITNGRFMTVKVTISNYVTGAVRVIAGNDATEWLSANGTYIRTLRPTSGTDIGVEGDVDFDGDIDDLQHLQWDGYYGGYHTQQYSAGRHFDRKPSLSVLNNKSSLDSTVVDPVETLQDHFGGLALGYDRDTDVSGAVEPVAGSGTAVIVENQHLDYHFKLWVIPELLQLSNPQLNTNIGFRLWNTYTDPETISSILVSGSSVLSFDITAGVTVLKDGEYRLVNMQIGPGEPTVEAIVSFITENLTGILNVLALISETFNLIPDVPVVEKWNFLTDILTTIQGTEQRISLRRYPRYTQEFEVEIIDLRQRREQYELLRKNIVVQSLVPFYQYATNATGITPIGGTTIYVDPTRTNMRIGEFLVAVNPTTEATVIGRVNQINADNIVINSSAGFQIDPHWLVMPAMNCLINDGSGITMNNVTGRLKVTAESFTEPATVRPGATRAPTTIDGITFLDRRPLIPAAEAFAYDREVLDNETGARDINSQVLHPQISGNRKFVIQRIADPEEMDYWRQFFDDIRGAQKPFLLSTFFPDLTIHSTHVTAQNISSMVVEQGSYSDLFFAYDTWKRIQMEWPNGTKTQHTVLTATTQVDGSCLIAFTPNVPDDPAYNVDPDRISYLMKTRASDTIVWRHFANYSEVSFGVTSTDE